MKYWTHLLFHYFLFFFFLTIKAPSSASDDILIFLYFFLEKNKTRHFIWIVCLADNSHEMSSLIYSEKKKKN